MLISHLNGLRALEATLRLGSFTAAAAELGVTPAAVGQRVRTLEEYLGKDLFTRTPSGIVSKDDVRSVEALLTNSFSGLAAALTELKNRNPNSRLSVTLPASFVENWLTSLISEFYQRHTSVDLRLDASNRDVDLLAQKAAKFFGDLGAFPHGNIAHRDKGTDIHGPKTGMLTAVFGHVDTVSGDLSCTQSS